MRIVRSLFFAGVSLVMSLGMAAQAHGQTAENVAVIVNDNSPDSQRIAEHYAQVRGLPESNVIRVRTTTDESIERDAYVKTIEQPIGLAIRRAGLQDRLLYLVLTKGLPLKIAGTSGVNGTLASVDSELTLLYRRMVGQTVSSQGKIENPYYLGDRPISAAFPFTHRQHDIYLVTRLDAYTVEQALALIDRAQAPSADGPFVLDRRGGAGAGSQWLEEAANRLAGQGHKIRALDGSSGEDGAPAIGFYSARPGDYSEAAASVALGSGSIAATFASFDARTFKQPPEEWRPTLSADKKTWFEGSGAPLIGDLIRSGATGAAGQVGEPYVAGAVRPQILFPAYLAGFNLAEAFYLSIPALSWQTVVIGDPLCAVVRRNSFVRAQLEEAIDTATGLPGLFAIRRMPVLRAGNPEVPAAALTQFVRAQTALERNDREVGRRALEEAVNLAPRAAGLMTMLAQLEEQADDRDAAIGHYEQVLQLQPGNVVVLNNLAYALAVYRDNPADALPLAKRAAGLAPRVGLVVDTLGWIEHLLGDDAAAEADLTKATRLDPNNALIHLHAAIVFMASGKSDRVRSELSEALRLDPSLDSSDDVGELRARIDQMNKTGSK